MRLTDDQVQRVRVPSDDARHRIDHVLKALAWVDEAEGGDDRPAFDAKLPLEAMAPLRSDRRHPMRYHDRWLGDPIHVAKESRRGLRHDDDHGALFRDAAKRVAHPRLRLRQDRMEGRDDRLVELAEKSRRVIVIGPIAVYAVEAELVLEVHDVDGRVIDRSAGRSIDCSMKGTHTSVPLLSADSVWERLVVMRNITRT